IKFIYGRVGANFLSSLSSKESGPGSEDPPHPSSSTLNAVAAMLDVRYRYSEKPQFPLFGWTWIHRICVLVEACPFSREFRVLSPTAIRKFRSSSVHGPSSGQPQGVHKTMPISPVL